MDDQDTLLRHELNQQTGKLVWKEMERYFAQGIIITVDTSLDLVEVAAQFSKDNKPAIEEWLAQKKLQHASAPNAKDWHARDPLFWSIVIAPWLLVQEVIDHGSTSSGHTTSH